MTSWRPIHCTCRPFTTRSRRTALLALLFTSRAFAQSDIHWAQPVDGMWDDLSRWTPNQVPDSPGARAIFGFQAPYLVSTPIGQEIELFGLAIENPLAEVRIDDPQRSGKYNVILGEGGITNHGLIRIAHTASPALGGIRFTTSVTLAGRGIIRLEDPAGHSLVTDAGVKLTNGQDHMIAGYGVLAHANLINQGTVCADVAGEELVVGGRNNSLLEARGGGILRIRSVSQSPAGIVRARDGGSVIPVSTLLHGTVETMAGGTIAILSDVRMEDVTGHGEWRVGGPDAGPLGASLTLTRGMIHDGHMQIQGSALKPARLALDVAGATIGGGVTIQLQNSLGSIVECGLTTGKIASGVTITGAGIVRGASPSLALTLDGLVVADVPGERLSVKNARSTFQMKAVGGGILEIAGQSLSGEGIDNSGIIEAGPGGRVAVHGAIGQATAASVRANGGVVSFEKGHAGMVMSGSMTCSNGGYIEIPPGARGEFGGVAMSGECRLYGPVTPDATVMVIRGSGLRNDGLIRLMSGTSSAACYVSFIQTGSLLSGSGELRMEDSQRAMIRVFPERTVTQASGHTISGSGSILPDAGASFINQGTLSPGVPDSPVGHMTVSRFSQGLSGIIAVDLGGAAPSERDSLLNTDVLKLAGTLRVQLLDGYTPQPCAEFPVIVGGSITGRFDMIQAPPMPVGALGVRYELGAVTVVYLPADHDGSGFVDTDDFTAFIVDFEAGSDLADIDHSGAVDTDDFTVFAWAFEQGC